jgi:hypothetical protein
VTVKISVCLRFGFVVPPRLHRRGELTPMGQRLHLPGVVGSLHQPVMDEGEPRQFQQHFTGDRAGARLAQDPSRLERGPHALGTRAAIVMPRFHLGDCRREALEISTRAMPRR